MRRKAILATLAAVVSLPGLAAATPADDLAKERRELEDAMAVDDASGQAKALVAVLQTAGDAEVRRYAHRALAQAYGRTLATGKPAGADVEAALLARGTAPEALVAACYPLTAQRGSERFVERCLAALPADPEDPTLFAERSRLAGTLAFLRKDLVAADKSLAAAAPLITALQDPLMHLRLAQAQKALGKTEPACATAKALYRTAPLLSGAREALGACGDGAAMAARLTDEAKQAFLATDRKGGKPPPVISLDDEKGLPLDLDVSKLGRVTVLVFFSTWCPHCGLELPRVAAFVKGLTKTPGLAEKVTVLGVRTAVEREREKYEDFAKRVGINFRVVTDSTMSLGFVAFARSQGREAALPTIAVLDPRGIVRFVAESGDFRDTATELAWAVHALVP